MHRPAAVLGRKSCSANRSSQPRQRNPSHPYLPNAPPLRLKPPPCVSLRKLFQSSQEHHQSKVGSGVPAHYMLQQLVRRSSSLVPHPLPAASVSRLAAIHPAVRSRSSPYPAILNSPKLHSLQQQRSMADIKKVFTAKAAPRTSLLVSASLIHGGLWLIRNTRQLPAPMYAISSLFPYTTHPPTPRSLPTHYQLVIPQPHYPFFPHTHTHARDGPSRLSPTR